MSETDENKLLKELEEAKKSLDKDKIKTSLLNCTNFYQKQQQYQKALDHLLEALQFMSRTTQQEEYVFTCLRIAKLYHYLPNLDKAMEFSEIALQISSKLKAEVSMADCYEAIGNIYRDKGMYKECLEVSFQARGIYEKHFDELMEQKKLDKIVDYANVLEVISLVYGKLEQHEKLREYLEKALQIYQSIDSKTGIIKIYINLGASFSKENPNKTLQYYQQALDIAIEENHYFFTAVIHNNIGGVYEDLEEFENAIIKYKEAYKIMEEHNFYKYQPLVLKFIGSSYFRLKDHKKALSYANKALDLLKKYKMNTETQEMYSLLSEIYEDKHDYKNALQFLKKSTSLKDQIFNKQMLDKMAFLQKKYDEASKQLTIVQTQKSLISEVMKKNMNMNFIGKSKAIKKVHEMAMTAASHRDTNVIITGESGTGKEIIAHVIHYASVRKEKLFIPVNCSSIPETLIEGEFFGYKKGAFTGAKSDHIGYLEAANGGTLFLDEIGDTPLSLQAKLLRVLENKKIKQLGSNKEIQTDFRIIAATNKNVQDLISKNIFRLDLLYRLNTIEVNIPPLRERKDDIEPLLEHFIFEYSKALNLPIPRISKDLVEVLKKYNFPGNVRELKNMVERAMIMNKKGVLEPNLFVMNQEICDNTQQDCAFFNGTMKDIEKQAIIHTLHQTDNNLSATARKLGISYSKIQRKIKEYEIKKV